MSQNSSILLEWKAARLNEQAMSDLARATAWLVLACQEAHRAAFSGLRIYLHGGLGAGKTTWVRHFLRACGVEGRIKSPSFSIVESYDRQGLVFHHLDFYRQSNPTQWQGGGLRDVLLEPAVILVEWPEHAQGLPPAHLELWIDWADKSHAEGPRQIKIVFHDLNDQTITASLVQQWHNQAEHLLSTNA